MENAKTDSPQPSLEHELVDRLIYFPLGMASAISKAAPNAVDDGRKLVEGKLQTAEFMGKMAVGYLKHRYETPGDLLKEAFSVVAGLIESRLFPNGSQNSNPESSEETDGQPLVESPSQTQPILHRLKVGGISEYDSLSATKVISGLEGRNNRELAEIERYELLHRKRRTVLAKLSQIRESLRESS